MQGAYRRTGPVTGTGEAALYTDALGPKWMGFGRPLQLNVTNCHFLFLPTASLPPAHPRPYGITLWGAAGTRPKPARNFVTKASPPPL
jgi:hypothetical protein